jgi:hypothetical protein
MDELGKVWMYASMGGQIHEREGLIMEDASKELMRWGPDGGRQERWREASVHPSHAWMEIWRRCGAGMEEVLWRRYDGGGGGMR